VSASFERPSGRSTHLPGETGVWVFILGDMLMFAAFFVVFVYYRAADEPLYIESQRALNQHYGALNTFLMLTSSWFVALAMRAARGGVNALCQRLILGAFGCGAAFVGVKYFEYSEKLLVGITPATNDFYMYYYVFTGLHLMHVLIGLGVLIYMWNVVHTRSLNAGAVNALESCATFWHMVDILWIVLFALLYLVR